MLEAAGINTALRARGIKEGDSVVIHEAEFDWQDDQSDAALYAAYMQDMQARGRSIQGSARWPHAH